MYSRRYSRVFSQCDFDYDFNRFSNVVHTSGIFGILVIEYFWKVSSKFHHKNSLQIPPFRKSSTFLGRCKQSRTEQLLRRSFVWLRSAVMCVLKCHAISENFRNFHKFPQNSKRFCRNRNKLKFHKIPRKQSNSMQKMTNLTWTSKLLQKNSEKHAEQMTIFKCC